jgi:hypothetical protein
MWLRCPYELAPGGRPFGSQFCEAVLGGPSPWRVASRPGVAGYCSAVRSPRETHHTSYLDDLKFAHAASLTVDVTLFNGRTFFAGVQAIDEGFGTVTLYEPRTFRDSVSQLIAFSEIVSVAVTAIEWHAPQ